jgi:hypothetical protein
MNAEDGPDAARLLDRAAGGDLDAWGVLLTRHHRASSASPPSASTRGSAAASTPPT